MVNYAITVYTKMDPNPAFKVCRWLDITDQQLKLLLSISYLAAKNRSTTPKDIEKEFFRTYGSAPQKSNLFSQLRALIKKGLVLKAGPGAYSVDFDVMERMMQAKRRELEGDLSDFDRMASDVKRYFRGAALKTVKPKVRYLDYSEFFKALKAPLNLSDRFYVASNFPIIAYTFPLLAGIERTEYSDSLWDLCFKQKKLTFCCLTDLDIDFPFNHAFRVFGDPKRAYSECSIIIDQLESQINSPNLDIRYLKDRHGMDVFIPERDIPLEFFMPTRDEHKNIIGGIEIRSPETALSAKQMFLRDYDYAERLQGAKGSEIIASLRAELEERYSICKI